MRTLILVIFSASALVGCSRGYDVEFDPVVDQELYNLAPYEEVQDENQDGN